MMASSMTGTGSCMTPQQNMPNFMGVTGAHAAHAAQLQTVANQQPHDLSSHHAHASLLAGSTMAAAGVGGGVGGAGASGLGEYHHHDTERRSSSIAALRLKAREHTVAAMGMHGMGILSVYGAK